MKALTAVMGVVVLVVVGTMAMQLVGDATNDGEHQSEWQYDDYKVIEGAVSAMGSLELVTVAGVEYVHAHSTGEGAYTTSSGEVSVNVTRALLDVYLMAGQSNAAYNQADPASADPVPPLGTAYAYMSSDGVYSGLELSGADPAFRSMTNPDGTSATADKAPAFAATYYDLTGHKSYWICGAVGGRAIISFDPDVGVTWDYMVRTVADAMEAVDDELFDVCICYYMWIQGEADSTLPVDTYKERFLKMHEAILDGDLGERFSHCFCVPPVPSRGLNAVTAQYELAAENGSTMTLVPASEDFTVAGGTISSDGVHWSQAGDNIVGTALGAACAEYRTSHTGDDGINGDLMTLVPVLLGIAIPVCCLWLLLPYIRGRD